MDQAFVLLCIALWSKQKHAGRPMSKQNLFFSGNAIQCSTQAKI